MAEVTSPIPEFTKDPAASLPYTWDWSAWLVGGDLVDSVVISGKSGLTISNVSNTTKTAQATFSGGLVGSVYRMTCTVTTTEGVIDVRSIDIRVDNR